MASVLLNGVINFITGRLSALLAFQMDDPFVEAVAANDLDGHGRKECIDYASSGWQEWC